MRKDPLVVKVICAPRSREVDPQGLTQGWEEVEGGTVLPNQGAHRGQMQTVHPWTANKVYRFWPQEKKHETAGGARL